MQLAVICTIERLSRDLQHAQTDLQHRQRIIGSCYTCNQCSGACISSGFCVAYIDRCVSTLRLALKCRINNTKLVRLCVWLHRIQVVPVAVPL